jgi:hypothetical protein
VTKYGLFLALFIFSSILNANALTNDLLNRELLQMLKEDQAVRDPSNVDLNKIIDVDFKMTKRMKQIVREYGWPTLSMVGKKGAKAAWLLVQHADMDREFQSDMLKKMIELIPSEEVDRKHVAYLDDRLSVASNRPQLYGTQGGCINAGKWEPKQIKNRNEVDERRKAMGMLPLADYIKKASEFLCVG